MVSEQTYVYRVQAVGANNEESELSLYASATVLIDDIAPATPGNFAAVLASSGTAIELSWDAPIRDANGGVLTGLSGFVIYRADPSSNVLTVLTTVDASYRAYRDTDLENRTTYRYQISAIDHHGHESVRSPSKTVTTTDNIVVAPTNLRASYNGSVPEVILSWTAPQEYDSFVVQRAVLVPGASSQDLTDTDYTALAITHQTTSYDDQSITSGTIYVYRVRTNLSGRISDPSNIVIVVVP